MLLLWAVCVCERGHVATLGCVCVAVCLALPLLDSGDVSYLPLQVRASVKEEPGPGTLQDRKSVV